MRVAAQVHLALPPLHHNVVNRAAGRRELGVHLRLRVHERGVGETLACGSGACAAVVHGRRMGWLDERVTVELPGGKLTVTWTGDDATVLLLGPTAISFEGVIRL